MTSDYRGRGGSDVPVALLRDHIPFVGPYSLRRRLARLDPEDPRRYDLFWRLKDTEESRSIVAANCFVLTGIATLYLFL